MTVINLTNGFFIEIDELNHTLKQKYIGKDKYGNPKEGKRLCGYFNNLDGAIGKFVKLNRTALLACETMELEEYVKRIERINKEAVQAIKSVLEGSK